MQEKIKIIIKRKQNTDLYGTKWRTQVMQQPVPDEADYELTSMQEINEWERDGKQCNFYLIKQQLSRVIGKMWNCGMRKVKCGIETCGNE